MIDNLAQVGSLHINIFSPHRYVSQVAVTTADGENRIVNKDCYPDLFWAIRGGGCNFGVVTEFVYRLHPQRRTVYSGSLIFAPSALDELIPQTAEWWKIGPKPKEGMLQWFTRGPDRQVGQMFRSIF